MHTDHCPAATITEVVTCSFAIQARANRLVQTRYGFPRTIPLVDSVSVGSDYELRFDGQRLDVWYKGSKRVYRCDPRMVRYRFSRARIRGGEYLDIYDEDRGGSWLTRVKSDDLPAVKAFIARVFGGGDTPTVASDPSEPSDPSELDQLDQLADLHDRGALTDEEFAAEKAKILGEG